MNIQLHCLFFSFYKNALLTQTFLDFNDLCTFVAKFVVTIYALFPSISQGGKAVNANLFAFRMYDNRGVGSFAIFRKTKYMGFQGYMQSISGKGTPFTRWPSIQPN